MTAPPMAYYGGKTRLATKIAALLPPHEHYVEPFAGSLAVLLAKQPSRMETVNDIDGLLMTFWRVLRNKPDELIRECALTPHSRAEYLEARAVNFDDLDDVEIARVVWVQISQGRCGTLRKTGWRTYIDPAGSSKAMPGYLDSYVERMAAAAERLHNVSLECRPAAVVIEQYGAMADCCLYVDPPYLGTARADGDSNDYRVDMRYAKEHEQLLDQLLDCNASVLLSGYASGLYDDALAAWMRLEMPASTGQGLNRSRTEVIWSNRSVGDLHLFDIEAAS